MQVRHWATRVCIGFAALMVASAVSAQTDPLVGTWKLDVAKSTYKPGPAPKSATVVVDPAGKGIKVAVDAVAADGSPQKWGVTTQRDGKEAPVTGNPMYDTATTTQTNPHSGSTVYKKDGKVLVTSKVEVSKDGKTLTITSTGTNAKGEAVNNVAHYVKQ